MSKYLTKWTIQFSRWLNHYTFKHGLHVGVEYTVPKETEKDLRTATILRFIAHRYKAEFKLFGELS